MIVDVNVSLSRWPFRRLYGDQTPELVEKLRRHGVVEAWAGSFDALLHKDISAVNERLADECAEQGEGLLVPFGAINPTLPDWEEDVRRCHEEHRMPGFRLHPNYHGYALDALFFARVLDIAVERGLIVQLAVKMEDPRTMHRLLQVGVVDTRPLPALVAQRPSLKLVMLNALKDVRGRALTDLAQSGHVYFDISNQEQVGGVGLAIQALGVERILFGSFYPFFIFESAELKLSESDLSADQLEAIRNANARRLLPRG